MPGTLAIYYLGKDESMELFFVIVSLLVGALPIIISLWRTWKLDALARLKAAHLSVAYLGTVVLIDNMVSVNMFQLLEYYQHDQVENLTLGVLVVLPVFLLAYALAWLVALIVSFVYPSRPR